MASSSNPVLSKVLQKYQGNNRGFTSNYNFPGVAHSQFTHQGSGFGAQAYPGGSGSFAPTAPPGVSGAGTRAVTYDDIVVKTALSLGLIVFGAMANFVLYQSNPKLSLVLGLVGTFVALGAVFVDAFKSAPSKAVTLVYAGAEGLAVGLYTQLISFSLSSTGFHWIAAQAFLGTVGVFVAMLVVYSKGIIRATPRFNKIIFGLIVGVLFASVGSWLISLFTHQNVLYSGGMISIVFSLVVIAIASLSLVTDFDQAARLVAVGAEEKVSWRVALGLSVTVVWIYTEILRLLSYLRSN